MRPALAPVGRRPQAGPDTGVGADIGMADVVPHADEDPTGVARVYGDVGGTGGAVRRLEQAVKRLAPVAADVEPPLTTRHVEVAGDRDVDAMRVRRVDNDAGDRARPAQAEVHPAATAVGRPVD